MNTKNDRIYQCMQRDRKGGKSRVDTSNFFFCGKSKDRSTILLNITHAIHIPLDTCSLPHAIVSSSPPPSHLFVPSWHLSWWGNERGASSCLSALMFICSFFLPLSCRGACFKWKCKIGNWKSEIECFYTRPMIIDQVTQHGIGLINFV